MAAWFLRKFILSLICSLFLLTALGVEATQITPTEFAEEVSRNNHTYLRPFRKAADGLVKLSTVTYPLTGNEPGWSGQNTVRGHVFDATNAVDAAMKDFFAGQGLDEQESAIGPPAVQIALKFMQLRSAVLNYLEPSVATDPYIWSFDINDDYTAMNIWVLIGGLWQRFTECCAANIQDGDTKAFQWVFNGIYDEEAGLWTMKSKDAMNRVQILGAMIYGLENLKIPANEQIEDIISISIENNFPASTYETLPKIVEDLEIVIQAFIKNLQELKLDKSGLVIEFKNRFEKDD
ncbi:hypothetical protein TWF481_002044 [Arthrobotrys musiformis]|uniref:Uncharacterized protein n=1 Tax=Arthrobotrys musiformis TaxID=47236 RepID=A0AAV9VU00_9PEZI